MLEEDGDDTVRDAAIIASAQRVEHYEMAAYGSTLAFANLMGHSEIAELLEMTLNEEKAADKLLSSIAEGEVNSAAPGMDDEESDEDEDATPKKASRKSAPAATFKAEPRKSTRR